MGKLKDIYLKDIDREIQGVIKVDDESYISQELEEYVVTDELLKHFSSFFEVYNTGINSNTEKMGVWISGFFGSGKSHFLKIISYLLENKVVNGKRAVSYFDDKISDKKLLMDIKRAGDVSSDVILFNIDSKASLDNVDGKDKILSVFEKVFNEKMGLSIIPHVAELERFLIREGKYEDFKANFKVECGEAWESARNDFYFRRDEVVNSYSKALGKSKEEAENWFDKAEERYELSVEKFAERVRDYIKSKGNNHHVVFLIDEVGQYIGDDRSLMLNLQTIVEDLGIECGGKAWVIVTSQEAIDDVVKVQGKDFSKIQGRFSTKLSLSSSDIDEVIKKRILDKNSESKKVLEKMYDREESVIRNLLTFNDANYQKVYDNSNDFSEVYPFIPYQFKLLQNVFTDIRVHGYAGKHLSSGERSLLGAFQETAKNYADLEVGSLIPFYAFYDTVEQFLDSQVKNVINNCEDMVSDGELFEIDVRVLKMLFMLKNVDQIPANIDNLATLYVSNIKDDKIVIKREIKKSLERLEVQTLIQRNNDVYKFLTNEEQEVNREIKQIVVDHNRVVDYLKKIVFDYILFDNKFTYKNKNFPLTKYIDNMKYSQEYEIGIKIITTFLDKDDDDISLQSSRENKYVFVKLDISTLIYDEIINYLQVEEYRRSKTGISQTQQIEDILRVKQREVQNVEINVRDDINKQLNDADIIIAGDKQNISAREARARINEALEILVNDIYTRFSYVKHNFSIQDVKKLFHEVKTSGMTGEDTFVNEKAYDAMKEYFEEKNAFGIPITIRTLLQDFGAVPYGFLDEDILYLLTKLLKDEFVCLVYGNEIQSVTSEDTLLKILKKDYYDRVIIKIRQKISLDLINDLKAVARNSFNVIALREDEDGMVDDFKNSCLIETLNECKKVVVNYSLSSKYQYPGKDVVENVIELIDGLLRIKDVLNFFTEVSNHRYMFLELIPKLEMIFDFFRGTQREQFDEAREILLIYDNNMDYTDNTEELNRVVNRLVEILTMNEPYSYIYELSGLRKSLIDILNNMYDIKSKPIIEMVDNTISYINNEVESSLVDKDFGKSYVGILEKILDTLESSNELKDIFAQQTRIEKLKDSFISELECEKNKIKLEKSGDIGVDKKIVSRKVIRTDMIMKRSYEINSKEDIDRYLEDLKEKLLEAFEDNNNLMIR